MINYTSHLASLIRDLVARVPALSHIDAGRLLVFARHGATGSSGPYATCHCLTMPPSDPGYYYWLDRCTGEMTRRSPWFVTESPTVTVSGRPIQYLISFALPRFCDQSLSRSPKRARYPNLPGWIGKLDTIVHELYHIDPGRCGLRAARRTDGREGGGTHGCGFHLEVAAIVRDYLASDADPQLRAFLEYDFAGLVNRFGRVMATTFRTFPSFPQRYAVPLADQPVVPGCSRVQPMPARSRPTAYSDCDLVVREFTLVRGRSDRRVDRRLAGSAPRLVGAGAPAASAAGDLTSRASRPPGDDR